MLKKHAIVVVTTMVVSLLLCGSASGSLILWNKLGSQTEVENSEIGPDGMIVGSNAAFGVFQESCRLKFKFMPPYFYQPLIYLSQD